MTDSHSHVKNKNAWKYLSFVLMGILAIGLSVPQASAAAADVSNLVQQILNIVKSPTYGNEAIMNAINGLSGSAATGEDVGNLEDKIDNLAENNGGFQIIRREITTSDEAKDTVTCTSDSDYMLHISGHGADHHNLRVFSGGTLLDSINISDSKYYLEVGGQAGESLKVLVIQVISEEGYSHGLVTLETAEGATASCTVS